LVADLVKFQSRQYSLDERRIRMSIKPLKLCFRGFLLEEMV